MPKLIDADALAKQLIELGFYPAIVKRSIKEAPAVELDLRWIDAKKQMPPPEEMVICLVSGKYKNLRFDSAYEMASFSWDVGWILESYPEWETPEVSWWMPLPKLPKEDEVE